MTQTEERVWTRMESGQGVLFEVEEVLSPRERWLRRHGVDTSWLEPGTETAEGPVEEEDQWSARAADGTRAQGPDELEAIVALARALGVRLWFEEGYRGR